MQKYFGSGAFWQTFFEIFILAGKRDVSTSQLHAEGCSNLYLATGYAADQFPPMDFIKAVVGKEPPL